MGTNVISNDRKCNTHSDEVLVTNISLVQNVQFEGGRLKRLLALAGR
jgi:hypothetical protein